MKRIVQRQWPWLGAGLITVMLLASFYVFSQTRSATTGRPELQLRPSADGTMRVGFRSVAGQSYRIEARDGNLGSNSSWKVLAENVVASADWIEWVDANAKSASQRFYRVVVQTAPAQTSFSPVVSANGASDTDRLLDALQSGDYQTALGVLRDSGVANSTVNAMASRLGQQSTRVALTEPFLRAAVSLSLKGRTDDVQDRFTAASALGYAQVYWVAQSLTNTDWQETYDAQLALCSVPPIGVLNLKLNDPDLVQYFKWYDRYTERLHSVLINGEDLSTFEVKGRNADVNRTLSGLYQLVKARRPDAFVWVGVVKQDDQTDAPWLQSLSFRPDGLQIWNLRQFHSPFAETRRRYAAIIGEDTPMMIAGFYGYRPALQQAGKTLSTAKKIQNSQERAAAKAQAAATLREIGKVVGANLTREEQNLQSLGFRGMGAHWLLLQAVDQANKPAAR